jgi:predicted metal-dependent hydrolase
MEEYSPQLALSPPKGRKSWLGINETEQVPNDGRLVTQCPAIVNRNKSGGQSLPGAKSKGVSAPHFSSIPFNQTMPLDSAAYHRGIRHFNAREFYDAHEVWEDVWRESHGLEKRFLQGLIQAAVAFHHHSTGNVAGACSLMERAHKNLAACPENFGGIGVRPLLQSLQHWRTALARAGSTPQHPRIVSAE